MYNTPLIFNFLVMNVFILLCVYFYVLIEKKMIYFSISISFLVGILIQLVLLRDQN